MDVPGLRTKNLSICAAMSINGMILSKIFERPLKGPDVLEFLLLLKETLTTKGISNAGIIMDNAAIHKYSGLKNIENEINIKVVYLPPYSPFLNPIENCFSKWKNYVKRSNANSEEELKRAIDEGWQKISKDDCTGYFNHMKSFIIKAKNCEIIHE